MIWNIIDLRTRSYRWKRIDAIIEATEHHNNYGDADQAPNALPTELIVYERREGISISEAVEWANAKQCRVTLYLYDNGKIPLG